MPGMEIVKWREVYNHHELQPDNARSTFHIISGRNKTLVDFNEWVSCRQQRADEFEFTF